MRLLHLIYIHGFQGNDTTFQSFPTDLHRFLLANIPSNLELDIQSSLYPTYKSVKPISSATKNFLEWLSTQPPGPVILLGHSMGGLLAAEAANHASNNHEGKPSRIVGVIAFDTPYLGMHPHVVITGIASLFRDKEPENKTTLKKGDLNDKNNVKIVDGKITDDWEAFKSTLSPASLPLTVTTASNSRSPSLLPSSSFPFVDQTLAFFSSRSEDPFVRWMRKHSNEPFTASKRWVVEHFQFGSCMFDPVGLRERYLRLVGWQGLWVNYWTQTVPRPQSPGRPIYQHEDVCLVENAMSEDARSRSSLSLLSPVSSHSGHAASSPVSPRGTTQKSSSDGKKRRHFVVLPNGLGEVLGGWERWENVTIAGAPDEVSAHCGLFLRAQNLDYDGLVENVGRKVLGWCKTI